MATLLIYTGVMNCALKSREIAPVWNEYDQRIKRGVASSSLQHVKILAVMSLSGHAEEGLSSFKAPTIPS